MSCFIGYVNLGSFAYECSDYMLTSHYRLVYTLQPVKPFGQSYSRH